MGIADSDGEVHDFQGPMFVNVGSMMLGPVSKFWRLDPTECGGGAGVHGEDRQSDALRLWDEGVWGADDCYRGKSHYLLWSNCHSHVASALNRMRYGGRSNWTYVELLFRVPLQSTYVSMSHMLIHLLPFVLLCTIVAVVNTIY